MMEDDHDDLPEPELDDACPCCGRPLSGGSISAWIDYTIDVVQERGD